jgi:hypothetical protein
VVGYFDDRDPARMAGGVQPRKRLGVLAQLADFGAGRGAST